MATAFKIISCQCTSTRACGTSTFVCQRISPALDSEAICGTVRAPPAPATVATAFGGLGATTWAAIAGGAAGCVLIVVCVVCAFRKRRELLSDSLQYAGDAESLEKVMCLLQAPASLLRLTLHFSLPRYTTTDSKARSC